MAEERWFAMQIQPTRDEEASGDVIRFRPGQACMLECRKFVGSRMVMEEEVMVSTYKYYFAGCLGAWKHIRPATETG
jgi:hypothetical protein